jgi:hypothetical protein
MDNFQVVTDRFLTWFKSVGGEFRDDLLEIKDLRVRGAGRGIGRLTAFVFICLESSKYCSCD